MATNNTPATSPANQERDALFTKLFTGMKPAEKKAPTILEVLMPYRKQIIAKRKEGYSLRQIGEALKQPPLCADASPSTLLRVIGGRAAKRRARNRKLRKLREQNLAKMKASAAQNPTPAPAPMPPPVQPQVRR